MLPIKEKSFVNALPIELNRTPKSISSLSLFFGVNLLMIWFLVYASFAKGKTKVCEFYFM
ncbi:MAG: hypothetical protein DBW73_05185 [Flavobacteriales bacterium]|nr:MAG: hypothetical protein DBW73_05185 [Flavobacteriales bacterium]